MPKPMMFDTADMAALLSVSVATLKRWAAEGLVPRAADGQYDAPEVIKAIRKSDGRSGPRNAVEIQRARKLERENRAAEGKLMRLEAACAVVTDLANTFNSFVGSIPGRCAPALAHQPAAVVASVLRREVAQLQHELAAHVSQFVGDHD